MSGKLWNIYIEFEGHPMYTDYFDSYGDMDESDVVRHVFDNILIEATED